MDVHGDMRTISVEELETIVFQAKLQERWRCAREIELWADPQHHSEAADRIADAVNEGYPHQTGTERHAVTLRAVADELRKLKETEG